MLVEGCQGEGWRDGSAWESTCYSAESAVALSTDVGQLTTSRESNALSWPPQYPHTAMDKVTVESVLER